MVKRKKGQRTINDVQSTTQKTSKLENKRQRIPKGQSKMETPNKLATQGREYKKQNKTKIKHSTICIEHHYTQATTNIVNKA